MKPALRRVLWTVAVAGTAAAVAWVDGGDDNEAGLARPSGAGRRTDARAGLKNVVPTLALERLDTRDFDEIKADLFAAKSWYVPPPVVAQKPKPPPLPFSYGGRIIEGDRTTVFLFGPDRNQPVRQGDLIDNTWRVDAINATVMKLTYLPLNESQTLALGAAP